MNDLIKDLGGVEEEEIETKEGLLEEYEELDDRLKQLRVMEPEAKQELRKTMEHLNGIQDNINRAEEELAVNNYKLQELNKK